VGPANAALLTATMLAQAVGFAVAGLGLANLQDPRVLYLADAASFAVAALIVSSLGDLGGGIATARLKGAVRRAWAVPGVAPLLGVAAATVCVIGMLNTALLPAAYMLSTKGASAYPVLEVCLIAGAVMGSLIAGRISSHLRVPALAISLWVFAVSITGVGLSSGLWPATLALALSGLASAVYSVSNTSALMDAASSANRGTVMSARFTVTQAGKAVGLGVGGLVTAWLGARTSFAAFGLGLAAVAVAYTVFVFNQRRAASATGASTVPPLSQQGH
jgi:hypothetical protein